MKAHILKFMTMTLICFASLQAFAQDTDVQNTVFAQATDEQIENNTEEYSDIIIIRDSKTGEKHTLVWMDEGYFLDLESLKFQKNRDEYVTRNDVTKDNVKKKPSFVGAVKSLTNAIVNPLCSFLKFAAPLIPVLVSTYPVWGKFVMGIDSPISPPAQDLSLDGIIW